MKNFFLDLFEYTHFMNQELIRQVVSKPESYGDRTRALLSHILNAHQIWNHRIENAKPPHGVWQEHGLHDLAFIDRSNFEMTGIILDNQDPEKKIQYLTSKGEAYSNTVKEILFHIVNHTTYHRGQIAADLKKAGIQPPVSDYIFYKR